MSFAVMEILWDWPQGDHNGEVRLYINCYVNLWEHPVCHVSACHSICGVTTMYSAITFLKLANVDALPTRPEIISSGHNKMQYK